MACEKKITYMVKDDKQLIQARTVLWWMIFFGALVNFAVQINLNMAMVDMVYGLRHANSLENKTICIVANNATSLIKNCNESVSTIITESNNIPKLINFSIEKKILNWFNVKYDDQGFHWNEYIPNIVFSSFISAIWLGGIPGGVISRRYGAKKCYGLATVFSTSLCFIIPLATYIDYKCLILLRFIQGFFFGLAQCLNIISFWVPPNERSQFMTAFLGTSVSIFVCYPIFGYIITISSWEYVFHMCGVIGFIWFLAWQLLVFDTPALHPRITLSEREYIENSLGNTITINPKIAIPWKRILTDVKCWSVILADVGCSSALGILMTYTPTYFKVIHKLDLRSTGLVTGIPYILKFLFAILCSRLADHYITTNKFTKNFVRKFATFTSNICHGTFALAFAFSGFSTTLSILFLLFSTTFHGSITAGPYASFVDISPNYSSILYGITTTCRTLGAIACNMFVGYITYENQTIDRWKIAFTASSIIAIITGINYVICFDASIRPWNNPQLKSDFNITEDRKSIDLELKVRSINDLEKVEVSEEENTPLFLRRN